MKVLQGLENWLDRSKKRRERDAKLYAESDSDLCMLCHAYGADKRTWWVSCFYAIHEVVPEALDTFAVPEEQKKHSGYFLWLCKSCRGRFLDMLGKWRSSCVALRDETKDHDGYICYEDDDMPYNPANIPVRINGRIVMLDANSYEVWKQSQAEQEAS